MNSGEPKGIAKSKTAQILEKAKKYKEERELSEGEGAIRQLVSFALAPEWYGLDIRDAKEILKVGKITRVPCTPDYIRGVMNLRGDIISVIDLKRFFGLPETVPGNKARIIVVESEGIMMGLLVDAVTDVIDLPISTIEPPLSTLEKIKGEYLDGQAQVGDRLLAILNLKKIMGSEEMKKNSGR